MKRFNVRYEVVYVNDDRLPRDVMTVEAVDEEGAKASVREWEDVREENLRIRTLDFISVDEVPKLGGIMR